MIKFDIDSVSGVPKIEIHLDMNDKGIERKMLNVFISNCQDKGVNIIHTRGYLGDNKNVDVYEIKPND